MALTNEDILVLIKKQPIGFVCAVVAAACGLLYYFHSDTIEQNRRINEQRSAEAANMLTNVKNSANLPEQVAALQAAGKELQARAVHSSELAINLQYFYKLEAETEVKLVDARQSSVPQKNVGKTTFIGVPFTVTVEGDFKQVFDFLQRLENGRVFCRINTFTINKAGAGDRISVNISLDLLGQP